jgi:xylan alpha-glucuronosyltransferase
MPVPASLPDRRRRFAYAFYATNDAYAVAALVFARLLQQLGIRRDVDLLTLHLRVSRPLVEAMTAVGITPRRVPRLGSRSASPLRLARRSPFRDSLTKLRVFELAEYDRVVFADVDAIPLKPLDYLFELPLSTAIAAPSAYWLPQPFWTSALLVLEPSNAPWSRVSRHLETTRGDRHYDMDVVNAEFAGEIDTLPAEVFCLNSEWEDQSRPGYFPEPIDAFSRVSVVHFTALGKPWSFSPEEVRRLRPNAHPVFYDLWETWRAARDDVLRRIRA